VPSGLADPEDFALPSATGGLEDELRPRKKNLYDLKELGSFEQQDVEVDVELDDPLPIEDAEEDPNQ
jgi:hypothetical protein